MKFVYDPWGRKYIPVRAGSMFEAFWNGASFLWGVAVGIGGTAMMFVILLMGIGA